MRKLANLLAKLRKIFQAKQHQKLLRLAHYLHRQGKNQEALKTYEQILQSHPKDSVALAHFLILSDRLKSH